MRIQNNVQNSVSFKQRYVIDSQDILKGVGYRQFLKDCLSGVGEKDIFSQDSQPLKKILVTTGEDTAQFLKEYTNLNSLDITVGAFNEAKANLIGKYFNGAIEFGEKQIEAFKNILCIK